MYGLIATSVFFIGLVQAATVFLSPQEDTLPSRLSSQQANLVLAAHLGLEQFEVVDQPAGQLSQLFSERDFVGQGQKSALLLLIDEAYAHDILPSTLHPSFSFSEPLSQPDLLPSFLRTCTRRASHVYTHVVTTESIPTQGVPRALDIFSAPTSENEAFLADMSMLVNYMDALPASDRFAALELTSVPKLAGSYGRSSETYVRAVEALRVSVEAVMADGSVRMAVVTYSGGAQRRRASALTSSSSLRSANVLASSSACFDSLMACEEETGGCSGHGQCMNGTRLGQACFVCTCVTTISDSGKSQSWVGDRCERKDVSGPFVLITGTVVTLVLLMGGAISLLYAIDGNELPSILVGGVSGGVRRE